MRLNKLIKSNDAVVGIVAAFLIVGLIVTVISVIQTQYVPKWMKEKEADHMNKVAEQFSELRYSIDIHSSATQVGNVISSSVVLGNKEIPYLMSVRSFGQLRILDDRFNIKIENNTKILSYNAGSIIYESFNSYYINQNYILEGGAVVLEQDQGESVLTGNLEENFEITYNLPNIVTVGNKDQSAVGYGPIQIQTEFSKETHPDLITNVTNITINTTHVDAWHSFINSTFIKSGLNYGGYNTDYSIEKKSNEVYIDFKGTIKVDMDIKVVDIYAQIGPGYIEQ